MSSSGRGEAAPEVVELEEGEIIDTSILSIPPTNNEQNPISTQNRNKNNKRNNNLESIPDTGRRGQGGGQPTPSTSSSNPKPTAASGAIPRAPRQNAVPPTPRQPPRQQPNQPSTSTTVVPRQPPRQPPNQPSTSTAAVPRPANPVAAAVDAANRAIAPGSVIRMATRYDEEGNAIVEPEVDRVIIQGEWEEQRVWLEGDDLNVAMEAAMDLVESDQGTGNRAIAFQAWNRTRGHLGVTPTDGPRTTAGAATARDSGEALINLVQGHVVPLRDGRQLPLRARWSSQLPRVSQWSVRYQGVARDPQALIESPVRGIGAMNGLSAAARSQIRFIASHLVGTSTRDTVIRFEVGETAAAEIQAVIGQRGGQIRIGATSTRVQHNHADIDANTEVTFNLQY